MPELDPSRRGSPALRPLLLLLGAYHLAAGLFMAAAPSEFYDAIAGFPPYNDHFIRDLSSYSIALGVVTIVAAGKRSWQVPVLAYTALQYALHIVNHVVDVGDTDPAWHGSATLVALAAVGAGVWWLYRRAREQRR